MAKGQSPNIIYIKFYLKKFVGDHIFKILLDYSHHYSQTYGHCSATVLGPINEAKMTQFLRCFAPSYENLEITKFWNIRYMSRYMTNSKN